jgi:hypothetical protein
LDSLRRATHARIVAGPTAAAAPPDRVDWEAFIPSQTEDTSELDSGDFIRSATGIA